MVNICLTCGDKGFSNALTFCDKCEVYSVHLYCLSEIPIDFDDVVWLCEDCEPKARKLSSPDKCSPDSEIFGIVQVKKDSVRKLKKKSNGNVSTESLNRPKDLSLEKSSSLELDLENSQKDHKYGRYNELDEKCSMDEATESLESKHAQLGCGECQQIEMNCSDYGKKDEKHGKLNKTELAGQGIDLREKDCCKDGEKTNLDEVSLKPEAKHLKSENHELPITHNPDIVEQTYAPAQPIEQPIWRGHLSISDEHIDGMLGLVAHLSNLSCPKVNEEAKLLPLLLSPELLPRSAFWPKSFAKWGPSDDSIALYFFPDNESSERVFDSLVKDMINQDLGLKAVVQNAELLIFASTLLPLNFWRFRAKYYLWGVFKAKRSQRLAANAVPGEGKGLVKVSDGQSSTSPLSNGFGSPLSSLSQSML